MNGHSAPWPFTEVVASSLTLFPCVSSYHLALVEEFLEGPNTELVSSFVDLSSQEVTGADKTADLAAGTTAGVVCDPAATCC